MKSILILTVAGLAASQLSAATVDWSKLPPAATDTGVTFDKDIAPILKASCVRCHGAERPRAQLRLDSLDGVMKGAKQGSILKVGDSANSLLVKAISQLDPETAMPPKPRGPRGPGAGPGGPGGPGPGPGGPGPGPGGPGGPPPGGDGDHGPGGPPPPPQAGPAGQPPGATLGTNGPGQFQPRLRPMGPPAKPLTPEQVGLVRAWIDQGAK